MFTWAWSKRKHNKIKLFFKICARPQKKFLKMVSFEKKSDLVFEFWAQIKFDEWKSAHVGRTCLHQSWELNWCFFSQKNFIRTKNQYFYLGFKSKVFFDFGGSWKKISFHFFYDFREKKIFCFIASIPFLGWRWFQPRQRFAPDPSF